MDPKDKKKIMKLLPFLTKNTTNVNIVVVHLISKGVLEASDRKYITQPPDDSERCVELYDIVTKKGPKAFKKLVASLRESGNTHVAKKLIQPVLDNPDTDSSDSKDDEPVSSQKGRAKSSKSGNARRPRSSSSESDELMSKLKDIKIKGGGIKKQVTMSSDEEDFSESETDSSEESSEDEDSEMSNALDEVRALMKSKEYAAIMKTEWNQFKTQNADLVNNHDEEPLRTFVLLRHLLSESTEKFTTLQRKNIGLMSLCVLDLELGPKLSSTCIEVLYKFGVPKLGNNLETGTKTILESISNGKRENVQIALEVLLGILCKDGTDQMKKVIGNLGGVETMLNFIEAETKSPSGKPWVEPWMILTSLTDENKENCLKFMEGRGLEIFAEYVEKYDDEDDGDDITSALITITNLADVESLRRTLLDPILMDAFKSIIENSGSEAYNQNNCMVVQTLSVLLSVPKRFWTTLEQTEFDHEEVRGLVRRCYNSWSPKLLPSCSTSTLKSRLRLLEVQDVEECQLSGAWQILNFIKSDGGRYKKIAAEEGALAVIKKTNLTTKNSKVKQLTDNLISILN